ncbi:MAG TPA: AAA-like domain-containing protein [Trichocoleus sp.]
MELEQLLAAANTVLLEGTGRCLSDVETAILQGAIADQTYEEISEISGYSVNYVKRDVGPKLWKRLSDALGETVSKTNFQAALARWQRQVASPQRPLVVSLEAQGTPPQAEAVAKLPLAIPEIYVERPPIEEICCETLRQPGALVRIKAPHLMGKTLLITRVLAQVAQERYRTISFSFEMADRQTHFTSINRFMRWFCTNLSRELGLPSQLDQYWDEEQVGVKISSTTYLEEYLLPQADTPLVLCLDNVDVLFPYPEIYEDFFGLLRSWHEKAKSRPLWRRLRLVLAHATDVYIRLHINQSPFNVGVPVELSEFTEAQAQTLAQQHGLPFPVASAKSLMELVGGHPYLLEQAFSYLKSHPEVSLKDLLAAAPTEAGIFSHHLREHWLTLQSHPELMAAFRTVLDRVALNEAVPQLEPTAAYQLQRMGLVKFCGNQAKPRCSLYQQYFSRYMSAVS